MNKVIKTLNLSNDNELVINFTDDSCIKLWDDGQSCCEHRYMVCEEDLSHYIGATYYGWSVVDGPTVDGESEEVKECQFLNVNTSLGEFQVANYNEHNGYYGGFYIVETQG